MIILTIEYNNTKWENPNLSNYIKGTQINLVNGVSVTVLGEKDDPADIEIEDMVIFMLTDDWWCPTGEQFIYTPFGQSLPDLDSYHGVTSQPKARNTYCVSNNSSGIEIREI